MTDKIEPTKLKQIEKAIAQAAYPDVHPDFTDAGWRRMAIAAVETLMHPNQEMTEAAINQRERLGVQVSQARPVAEFKAMLRCVLARG